LAFLVRKYTIWQPCFFDHLINCFFLRFHDVKKKIFLLSLPLFFCVLEQGDQIGRIFAYWAIAFFWQFLFCRQAFPKSAVT
jgi:hypothetical protein